MKGRPFVQRLRPAGSGIVKAWRGERSFRSQTILAAIALGGAAVLRVQLIWWVAVVLVIALVLVAELVNSSIEALADHLHPAKHSAIETAKDIAAGGVLIASFAALIVGACLVLSAVLAL
jgi:diacylglycerol kinase (ATP)